MTKLPLVLLCLALPFAAVAETTKIGGIEVVSTSALPGEGNVVRMGGRPIKLSGQAIGVGEEFPTMALMGADGKAVTLGEKDGKVKIVSVVPNLMTKVCEVQTHNLSEESQEIADKVDMITVSTNTTEEQTKFASEAKIDNVKFLSDKDHGEFGKNTGLLVSTDRFQILARAVIVVDGDNKVRYLQVMEEITTMPDMDRARKEAAALL